MGLPAGWTSAGSLSSRAIADGLAACLMVASVPAATGNGQKHRTLSLFSGCGALDFGFFALVRARRLLRRMRCRRGHRAREAAGRQLAPRSHTQGHPQLERRQGRRHPGGVSVSRHLPRGAAGGSPRPAKQLGVRGVVLGGRGRMLVHLHGECGKPLQTSWSVAAERGGDIATTPPRRQERQPLLDALGSRGFAVKWCVVEAAHIGAPQ